MDWMCKSCLLGDGKAVSQCTTGKLEPKGPLPHTSLLCLRSVPRKQLNTGGKSKSAGLDDYIYDDAGDGDDDFM